MIKLKASLWCMPMAAALVVAARPARAESPPVEVQIVAEGADDDFLTPQEKKQEPPPAAAEDDAEAEEEEAAAGEAAPEPAKPAPKKGKGRATARVKSDGNAPVQTQVVNIVVGGPEQQTKSEAKSAAPAAPAAPPPPPSRVAEERALEADMEAARRRIAEVKAAEKPPAQPVFTSVPVAKVERRGRGVERGDLLASFSGGNAPTGVFLGGRLELMLSDWFGLEARGLVDPVRQGHGDDEALVLRRGLRVEQNGRASWASPGAGFDVTSASGVTFMGELNAKVHLLPGRAFDPNLSIGAAHFGYRLSEGGTTEKGGGVYMKAAAGLNWHWRYVFVGGEAAWYPLEAVRYSVEDGGRRSDVVKEEGRTFDARRLMFSGHAGLRF